MKDYGLARDDPIYVYNMRDALSGCEAAASAAPGRPVEQGSVSKN